MALCRQSFHTLYTQSIVFFANELARNPRKGKVLNCFPLVQTSLAKPTERLKYSHELIKALRAHNWIEC